MGSFAPSRSARLALAAIAGGVLLLAFPPVDLGPVAFVALVPLWVALRDATPRMGLACGGVAGLVFFGGALYWIAPFGVLAWVFLGLLQATTWALFGFFAAIVGRRAVGRLLGWPALFVGGELLRGRFPLGGFPWGLLGTTQHNGGPLLPLARVGGVWLIGIALVVVSVALTECFFARGTLRRLGAIGLAALVALAPAMLPLGAPQAGQTAQGSSTIDIAAIQVRVPEGLFSVHRGQRIGPEDATILDDFIAATAGLRAAPPALVVWPENAIDRDPLADPSLYRRVAGAAGDVGAPILAGAILDAGPGRFRNSLLLFGPDGAVRQRYDKRHLVPFGEYVPWPGLRRYVPALRQIASDGIAGKSVVVFDVGGARIGAVVCFESIFPGEVRASVRRGAQILIIATNNASFGRTTASAEHIAQSQLRAVEEGRSIVHAAISGISAIIDPRGRVRQQHGIFTAAVMRDAVPLAAGLTPYARFGAVFETAYAGAAGIAVIATFSLLVADRRRRKGHAAEAEFDWHSETPGSGETS